MRSPGLPLLTRKSTATLMPWHHPTMPPWSLCPFDNSWLVSRSPSRRKLVEVTIQIISLFSWEVRHVTNIWQCNLLTLRRRRRFHILQSKHLWYVLTIAGINYRRHLSCMAWLHVLESWNWEIPSYASLRVANHRGFSLPVCSSWSGCVALPNDSSLWRFLMIYYRSELPSSHWRPPRYAPPWLFHVQN